MNKILIDYKSEPAEDLYKKTNIQFLMLVKIYSNGGCAVISEHQDWTQYWVENNMQHHWDISHLKFGLHKVYKSIQDKDQKFTLYSYENFGLTGLACYVKPSECEVGCYFIYHFGIGNKYHNQMEQIYNKYRQSIVLFMLSFEKKEQTRIDVLSGLNNRLAIRDYDMEENQLLQWSVDIENISSILLKATSPF